MLSRHSLLRRITLGLAGFMLALTAALSWFAWTVHEAAEQHAWEAVLVAELQTYRQRSAADPAYRWQDTESLSLHRSATGTAQTPFLALPPGLHDEVPLNGSEYVVLVQDGGNEKLALALDISLLERNERSLAGSLIALTLAVGIGLMLAVGWGAASLVRPLRQLAGRIDQLSPEASAQRLELDPAASAEQATITAALNHFLDRNSAFVERERAFIDTASHELRTPVTVIAGAAQLALGQPELPPVARGQLKRIQRSARDVERLLPLLLALAKAPERLRQMNDMFELGELLPDIVDDHRHLLGQKALHIELGELPRCPLRAPLNIVQAALGNLLRNAIENSDSGCIRIDLSADGVVRIADPGQQMSPEQVSQLYARLARGEGRDGGGIGLDLISRLCRHLDWKLSFAALATGGTLVTLDLGASLDR
jgi:signal transduction histidine kinase